MDLSKIVKNYFTCVCNNKCVANHSGSRKPAQSVNVVIIMDDATAGSIPTLFNISGMDAPVSPATIKLPVMAQNKTRPSITLAS